MSETKTKDEAQEAAKQRARELEKEAFNYVLQRDEFLNDFQNNEFGTSSTWDGLKAVYEKGHDHGFDAGVQFAESSGAGWVSVKDDAGLPPLLCGQWLITYCDDNNRLRVCRANYYPKFTLSLHEDAFEEDGEMDPETEELYTPAGWYEVSTFSDEGFLDKVIGKVLAYMPLPQPYTEPAAELAGGMEG